MSGPDMATTVLSGIAGLALGLVHYLGLFANTRMYLKQGKVAGAIGLHLGRLAFTALGLTLLAQAGAAALLAAFAGLLVARPTVRHFVARR
jgi:N-ATPase, AtpR subunit